MSKPFKYPKPCGFCAGGKASPKAKYAQGGHVESKERAVDVKQDKAVAAKAVHKHEAGMHKGEPKTKFAHGGIARLTARRSGMLGSGSNKPLPQQASQAAQDRRGPAARMIGKRGVPVASGRPLIEPKGESQGALSRIRSRFAK